MKQTGGPTYPRDWKGVRVAVLGYGVNNRALVDWLITHGAQVTVCDQNIHSSDAASDEARAAAVWKLGEEAFTDLDTFAYIFRTPGIRPDHPAIVAAVQAGATTLTSQTELFAAIQPGTLIGITGTKGKGTTASLLHAMLEAGKEDIDAHTIWLSGNIGNDPFTFVDQMQPDDYVILELSSFQLFNAHIHPHVAIMLSITPDHLDYHTSWHEYLGAKSSLLRQMTSDDIAVLHDGPHFDTLRAQTDAQVYAYSRSTRVDRGTYIAPHATARGSEQLAVFMSGEGSPLLTAGDLTILGIHNLENAAAAACVAYLLGVGRHAIVMGARSFTGLPHRLQKISDVNGVICVDDSIATTPEAGIAAIEALLPAPIHLLAGGVSKGVLYDAWAAVAEAQCASVTLFGRNATELAQHFTQHKPHIVDTLNEAVQHIMGTARPGDVVLLSPVSASFDQYANYVARSDDFIASVRQYQSLVQHPHG